MRPAPPLLVCCRRRAQGITLMSEAVVVLVNPAAGRGRCRRLGARAITLLENLGLPVETVVSRGPGHLADAAEIEARRGRARVIALGGDGTLSEVARGLLDAGETETLLGAVPLGTGNDFVKSARLPAGWRRACERLARRCVPHSIDAGRVNGRWFINGVGLGFDAAIVRAMLRHTRLPGPLGYAAGLLDALRLDTGRPLCRIRWDGGEDVRAVTLVAACNGQYAGGLFRLAPEAALDDGRLDIVWADALSALQVLRHAPRVIRGAHLGLPIVHTVRAARVDIESDRPMPVQADGDLIGEETLQLSISVAPRALRLWT
jgi:diacylglycerol kinase (ATP)